MLSHPKTPFVSFTLFPFPSLVSFVLPPFFFIALLSYAIFIFPKSPFTFTAFASKQKIASVVLIL